MHPEPHDAKLEYDVYEVFARTSETGSHEHLFSLLASSPDMALSLARENFLRRCPVYSIWVVPRDQIAKSRTDDPDAFFRQPKDYREAADYRYLADKWRQYRQEAMNSETMA